MRRTHTGFRIAMSAILAMSVWHTQALQVYAQQVSEAADAVASAIAAQQAPAPETVPAPEAIPEENTVPDVTSTPEATGAASAVADSLAATPAPSTPDAATTQAPAMPTTPATPATPATPKAPATLTPQASDPVTVTTWPDLQTAVNEATDNRVVTLGGDIVAGDGDETIGIGDWQSVTLDLAGHTLNRNLTEQDDDNHGHVIDVYRGTLTIRDSSAGGNPTGGTGKITGGYDELGGGIVISGSGHVIVESGTITGNQAYNGGGIYLYKNDGGETGTQLKMTGGKVEGNIGGDCGGIYNNGGIIDLDGAVITGNSTRGAGGAGINNKGQATLKNCVLNSNVSDAEGGGIYNGSSGTLDATNCSLNENTSKGDGAGICSYGTCTLTDCGLNKNETEVSGGGIRVRGGITTLKGTNLNKNKATEFGGGIFCNNGATLQILQGSAITENVGYKGGGGVYVGSQMGEVQVGSGVVVTDNLANNIYLTSDRKISVVEGLAEGTTIGVSLESSGGIFTTGYKDTNDGVDPGTVFVPEAGYSAILDSSGEARIVTSDWVELQRLIDDAGNGATITLDRSWQAADENVALNVAADKNIIIDLNGYKIDRHRSSGVEGGEVFTVWGKLNIVDNSYDKKGQICGGYGRGGGVIVCNGGSLKLQSGNITGNRCYEYDTTTYGGGAGVRVESGGTFEAYGGAISNNTSDDTGGGVYVEGTFTSSSCAITGNRASKSGGGIHSLGTTTLQSGSVDNNTAGESGGGVLAQSGTFTMNGGTVTDNRAAQDGGGIFVNQGSEVNVNGGTISKNSTSANGGAFATRYQATLRIKDATITENVASVKGGAVYCDGEDTLEVQGAPHIQGNNAAIGNNVLLKKDSYITIAGELNSAGENKASIDVITQEPAQSLTKGFTTQHADITCFTTNGTDQSQLKVGEGDGELYIKQASASKWVSSWQQLQDAINTAGDMERIGLEADITAGEDDDTLEVEAKSVIVDLNGHTLDRNLSESEGSNGHVLEAFDGSDGHDTMLMIDDTVGTGVIRGGYADNGGGIYVHEGASVTFAGGTISDCRATSDGGGVYVRGAYHGGGNVIRCYAEDNGGGIYAEEDGHLELEGSFVTNNTSHNEGGGIDVRTNETGATMSNCFVRDNHTEDDNGGGIYLNESSLLLTLTNCAVSNNNAGGGHDGGGIYVDDGRITVNGGAITNNSAKHGGGIYNNECAIVVDGTVMSKNVANDGRGGAIRNEGSCQVYRSTLVLNSATDDGGAIYSEDGSYLKVEDSKFEMNRSEEQHGGAVSSYDKNTFTRCTFLGNSAPRNGGALDLHDEDTTIDSGTFMENSAGSNGGAVHQDNETSLYLVGSGDDGLVMRNNSAILSGGGVCTAFDTSLSMSGKVIITDNEGGNDLFIYDDTNIRVAGDITGSQVRVILDRDTGVFTSGYSDFMSGQEPDQFFMARAGYAVIPAGNEAQIVNSDWVLLQKLIDSASDGATIKLERDWKAAPQNAALQVGADKNITIDLNGHVIDRARDKYEERGEVFNVSGTLTITDTSEGGAGRVTGGYGDGGGAVVQSGGSLTLAGGQLQGNKAKNGAGALVGSGGSLSVTGGLITGNYAEGDGGGIHSSGALVITGGQITQNQAAVNAGGVWANPGSTLSVGDKPYVLDNIATVGPNLYLGGDVTMGVTQRIDSAARVDLVAQSPARALTSGLTTTGSADVAATVFTYGGATGRLEVRDGELYVIQPTSEVTVSDWQALQDAINDEANRGKVIRLANDITATEDDDRLLLEGKEVIVDLNGHALNRNLDDDDNDGHVFELKDGSTLTIKDTAGTGRVTGGYAERGGAINIHEGCTCNVEGGTFVGNRASEDGGAFYVYGTLNMTGGIITRNNAHEGGGGIFVTESGTINLENVVLVSNTADKWGGGAINNKGNATLKSCVVRSNNSGNEGGAIYNGAKSLTLDGCTIDGNSSGGGGALCCYGTTTITDTDIINNYANDYGGGLYVRGSVTITGGTISNNVGRTDGGGIYNEGGLLSATGVALVGNSTEAGGGALNNKGTTTLDNCTLTSNHANSEGGCIYAGRDGATTLIGCELRENTAGSDGGGIATYGILTASGTAITSNKTDKSGGGIYSRGDTTLTNTTVTGNEAKKSGGGLCAGERTLTVDGGTIKDNIASDFGGGLMVESGMGDVAVKGAVQLNGNTGSGDVFLPAGKVLTVGGALDDGAGGSAKISVRAESGAGTVITSGYAATNPDHEPSEHLTSNDGLLVVLENGEAVLRKESLEDTPFIDRGSQINPEEKTLNSVNWMSGLSGELRLNEINIPATHDSGTKEVRGNLSTGKIAEYVELGGAGLGLLIGLSLGSLGLGLIAAPLLSEELATYINDMFADFANCQTRYIDEQLADGIRHIDIRLNTYYVEKGWPTMPKEDNGHDLYLCHGKDDKAGTYFAVDYRNHEDGEYDFITFMKVLGWVKTFLEEHPTETIKMNVQVESVDDVDAEALARIRKHLHDELATQINPSTNKPYLYMQDGVFGRKLTEYPKVKDCRGQVVIECSDSDAEVIGGLVKGTGLTGVYGADGSYKDNANAKIRNLRRFFADHGYDNLPSNAMETIDYLYSVSLNGTDTRVPPQDTPLDIAKEVLEVMFGEGGLVVDKIGKYIGHISMDGANAEFARDVWITNFFSTRELCKVTVKSGCEPEQTKTYTVEWGTEIPIPDCIFTNPNDEGKYFQYWQGSDDTGISDITWKSEPGETWVINGDTTFVAQWGEQNTRVRVLWHDGENADNLRPESLPIHVTGEGGVQTDYNIAADNNWNLAVPGNVKPEDVTVDWDKIGQDAEGTYACSVRPNEAGLGLIVELTHTPEGTVQAQGSVKWVDDNDAAGKRPLNVTVHLLANSRVVDSATVTQDSNWTWDLGERPLFEDGEAITYSVSEDVVESYITYENDFDITNVYNDAGTVTEFSGLVVWSDNDDAGNTRPDSVTINLLQNSEVVQTQEVTPDENGLWIISFEVPGAVDASTFSVSEEPVEGYDTTVYDINQTAGALLVVNATTTHEHTPKTVEKIMAEPTCTTPGTKRTVVMCSECGEVLSSTDEEIAPLGHVWSDWEVTVEATETRTGFERRTCTRDRNHVETRVIPKVGHTHALVHVPAVPATCTEDGINEHWVCSGGDDPCGLCFADAAGTEWIHEEATVAHALGHDWGDWEVVTPATETSEGLERRTCKHDSSHTETRVIPVLEHTHGLVHVDAVEPTCTSPGNVEYWRCIEGDHPCGLLFADAAATTQLEVGDIIVPATGHNWGAWRMTKTPTESEFGEEVRICHNDPSHTQTRNIPKVGHTHALSRVESKPATCTEDGNREYWQCTEGDNPCGLIFADKDGHEQITLEDTVIHAPGHAWNSPTYEWAPDNSSVTALRVCKHCGETESQTMPTTSVVTREPQFGVPGQTTYTAIFPNLAFRPQQRAVDDIPALSGVAYVGNGATSGSMDIVYGDAGTTVTLAPCAYKRSGYDFVGWNTRADGKGTMLMPGAPFALSAGGDWLFAQWKKVQPKASQVMYRLYNPNSGEHFYTANAHERDVVAAAGWTYEGVGWTAPLAGAPVYRLYNPNAGDHHYTINASERDALIGVGWLDEGIGWRSARPSGKPLYREYNPNARAGAHNFTQSRNEHLTLVSLGWHGEGIAWYGL